MLEKISGYIDLRLLGIGCLILASFIFLRVLFKKVSMPKILAILLSSLIVVGNAYVIYLYLEKEESEFIETAETYYLKGEVKFVSDTFDKLRIHCSKTNMVIQDIEDMEVLVRVTGSTGIYKRESGEKISLRDLKTGDSIAVVTNVSSLKDGKNEVKAKKIYQY